MRRPGIWVANGMPPSINDMYRWRPGAVTCFVDYLGANDVYGYKQREPEADIIIRFQHPMRWNDDPEGFAKSQAEYVLSKWPEIKGLDPYVYFVNEMNLHYENGQPDPGAQWAFETPDFYQRYARWVTMTADRIKQRVPEMKLVCPPFASGHYEDGEPDDDGNPKVGWAGYDYLAPIVPTHFDNILTAHAYWGNSSGCVREQLYQPVLSSWYAFRYRRVKKLFKTRYGIDARFIIDEAGNFDTSVPDFTDQVKYYSQEMLMDPSVIALTFFLMADPTKSPGNMPNSWERCQNLSQHIAELQAMPDVTVNAHPNTTHVSNADDVMIRVYRTQSKTIETMTMDQYLAGVIPAEMPALSKPAALFAQTIWAKSYAMEWMARKNDNFDVADNASFQVYDPDFLDKHASDHTRPIAKRNVQDAIKAAHGLYLVREGKPFFAEYIWYCGMDYCPAERCKDGKIGYNGKDWPGRGCQEGAMELARQGMSGREIALYYYDPSVTFNKE